MSTRIEVAIIVEGYNETLDIGSVQETLEALRAQTYPLQSVEVLLVGSSAQAVQWGALAQAPAPFAAIRAVDGSVDHYYALKNRGAQAASAEVVVFVDSDVMPEPGWLAALMEAVRAGAVATCGPSLFRQGPPQTARTLPLLVAAAISWNFIVGPNREARAFLSHNLGFRREAFDRIRYRTDFGRTLAGSVLWEQMCEAGIKARFVPQQSVAHAFTWRWWFTRLHVRFGHEVYLLHRLGLSSVSKWARRLGPLDAIATPLWHIALDIPNWWRYSGALGLPLYRRIAGLPLVLPLSILARGGEMAGMLGTVFDAARMREFAAHN